MQGTELRALRQTMNMRQGALAEALGLSAAFIGMMERGEKPIELRTELAVRYLAEHPERQPSTHIDDIKVRSIADMLNDYQASIRLVDGRKWGDWRFATAPFALVLEGEAEVDLPGGAPEFVEIYDIPLDDMLSAKNILDWIGQIAGKGWGVANLGYLVQALDEIFDLQGTFAHGRGFANADEVRAYLSGRLK